MFCVMFQRILSFDIHVVSKNMFCTCLCHVLYKFLSNFPICVPSENKLYIMSCLWRYFLFQLHITSFYNFISYVSNTLIFCYLSSFMRHDSYGFDRKFTMLLPCFRSFETCLLERKFIFQGHVLDDFSNQCNKVVDVTKLQNVTQCFWMFKSRLFVNPQIV